MNWQILLLLLTTCVLALVQAVPAGGPVPNLVDESQVNGLEDFLTQVKPDLRELVIKILAIYERTQKDQVEEKLRQLMQQQPYELLDRLFELYQKARRKEIHVTPPPPDSSIEDMD